jgi:subtilisin family serine protease
MANDSLVSTDLGAALPGLEALWAETRGDNEICVAVLDGPVDLSHPTLKGANIRVLPSLVSAEPADSPATRHGTHVASVIFGQQHEAVRGVSPECRGLSVPIFQSDGPNSFHPCSQLDLARAITQAMVAGAHIINVSGGEFSPSGEGYPLLADVIKDCALRGVLIVAAAGNQGCECLHVPAAMAPVLAVGAMDAHGEPLPFSNWGIKYRLHGILAPGEHIAGAVPGGGWTSGTGTSYATAVVSGVAALLLSLQKKHGRGLDPIRVREAILKTAIGCRSLLPSPQGVGEGKGEGEGDCRRVLAGRLNVKGAVSFVTKGNHTMSEPATTHLSDSPGADATRLATGGTDATRLTSQVVPSELHPSACAACQVAAAARPQHVYIIGQVGYDFGSEARRDSFGQKMTRVLGSKAQPRSLALDPKQMIAYLNKRPAEAASLEWTLGVDDIPLYAIRPAGPFASEAYDILRNFLRDHVNGVERCSIAGIVAGTARLLLGHEIPLIVPEVRAMQSWNTSALVTAVAGRAPAARARTRTAYDRKVAGIHDFLHRVHHEHRNLGALPEHRAMNYAATNAMELGPIYEDALNNNMELHNVRVVRSPIGRPGSDCWDVEIYFFRPQDPVAHVKKVYRYTVDVSDIVPVILGPVRSWFTT